MGPAQEGGLQAKRARAANPIVRKERTNFGWDLDDEWGPSLPEVDERDEAENRLQEQWKAEWHDDAEAEELNREWEEYGRAQESLGAAGCSPPAPSSWPVRFLYMSGPYEPGSGRSIPLDDLRLAALVWQGPQLPPPGFPTIEQQGFRSPWYSAPEERTASAWVSEDERKRRIKAARERVMTSSQAEFRPCPGASVWPAEEVCVNDEKTARFSSLAKDGRC